MIIVTLEQIKTEDGRHFIRVPSANIMDSVQCASCLNLQPLKIMRGKDGRVYALSLDPSEEQHAENCQERPRVDKA